MRGFEAGLGPIARHCPPTKGGREVCGAEVTATFLLLLWMVGEGLGRDVPVSPYIPLQ